MSQLKRCTVGYLQDGNERDNVIVDHVFADGRVRFKYMQYDQASIVTDPADFTPSREAYISIGSYVEPKWDGDSCRLLNAWAEGNYSRHPTPNQAENIRTDAEMWDFLGVPTSGGTK